MGKTTANISGPTNLDAHGQYTITNRDGAQVTGSGVEVASWAEYWADDPTPGMFTGPSFTSDAPGGRDVFSAFGGAGMGTFGGAADVSFEHVVRHFQIMNTRFPPPRTAGANNDAPEPEAFIEWGGAADFYTEEAPTDPVEDINADGFAVPVSNLGGAVLQASSLGAGGALSTLPGSNTGGYGTSFVSVGAGKLARPRERKPQDKRPGVNTFEEIDRFVQRGLVFNPNDRDQWVAIERTLSIRFRGKDGVIMKFNFKPPPFPPSPERSSSEEENNPPSTP